MKWLLLFTIWLLLCNQGLTQTIPNTRTVDWEDAWTNHYFVTTTNEVNVRDFGATGNGVTDDQPAIQAAIQSLDGHLGMVFFPSGNYVIKTPLTLYDSVILKGVSSESTTISLQFGEQVANGINIQKNQTGVFVPIVDGLEKESTDIIVADVSSFEVGQTIEIRQKNGNWDVVPISWADYSVGQITEISQIVENTLTLRSPLRISYSTELNPEVRPLTPITNVGVECLKIKRKNAPAVGAGSNINFSFATHCRVMGVESDSSVGSHIQISQSSNILIEGSYLHDAFTYDGTGTRGYGVTLSMHTSECVIVDNIFKKLRHAMMVKTGSNGNIFGYNYSIEPFRSEPIPDFSGDISLHGHYAFANLFEGNIVQNIIIDHYWGPSGPWNTFFRNRAELYGIFMTSSDLLMTGKQNFVGNEVTNTEFLYGLYFLTGEDNFEFGNNIKGNIMPEGTQNLPDSSYYLCTSPSFWNNDIWPSIGTPLPINTHSIPSRDRYIQGNNLTVCPEDSIPTIIPRTEEKPSIRLWPNPVQNTLFIASHQAETMNFRLVNMLGQSMISQTLHFDGKTQIEITIPSEIVRGSYIAVFEQGNRQVVKKLLILKP